MERFGTSGRSFNNFDRCLQNGAHRTVGENGGINVYKEITFNLKGVSPAIIHSGRMANPLDPLTKLMKQTTGKRKKSDEDIALMADIEWLGAFYPSEPGEVEVKDNKLSLVGFGVPGWPGENIEAMLVAAAKMQRLGKQFKAGILCDGFFPLKFGEDKNIEQIFSDPKYRDTRRVRVQTATIMRTRPIFQKWSLRVTVSYLEELLNEQQIQDAMQTAGVYIGLSDYRPKYGRFTIE